MGERRVKERPRGRRERERKKVREEQRGERLDANSRDGVGLQGPLQHDVNSHPCDCHLEQ